MGRFGTFLIGFLLGGVFVYVGLHYHILRTNNGMDMVPKLASTASETYVDIRAFGFEEWRQHPALAAAITKANKSHLFQGVVTAPIQGVQGAVNQSFEDAQSRMNDFFDKAGTPR